MTTPEPKFKANDWVAYYNSNKELVRIAYIESYDEGRDSYLQRIYMTNERGLRLDKFYHSRQAVESLNYGENISATNVYNNHNPYDDSNCDKFNFRVKTWLQYKSNTTKYLVQAKGENRYCLQVKTPNKSKLSFFNEMLPNDSYINPRIEDLGFFKSCGKPTCKELCGDCRL